MKTVNLLPQWYLQRRRDRVTLQRRLVLLTLLAVAGLAGLYVFSAHNVRLEAQLQKNRQDALLASVSDLSDSLKRQQTRIQHLQNIRTAYRDVGNTVPMSAVLQQIQNNMTPGMAISRAFIEVRQEPVKTPPGTGDPAHPKTHEVAHFTIVGIAPNDVLIAQMIGKISNNPLFGDIALNYTRTDLLRDFSVRRFEIQMAVDLDRLAAEETEPVRQALLPEVIHAG